MDRCHTCGKTESRQAICPTCGKTFCADHIDRRCHQCFSDPGSSDELKMNETYDSFNSFKGTPTYYKDDGFDERTAEILRKKRKEENPGILGTLLSSPTLCILLICIFVFAASYFSYYISPELYVTLNYSLMCWPDYILQRPWSLITYMFCHKDIAHLFVNMFVLYSFGTYLEKRIGNKWFLLIYFVSGIFSAVGFSLFSSNPILGASGAVMGILAATAAVNPNIRVMLYFAIPLKITYAVILFAILDLILNFATPDDSIAHIGHLSGLVIGYLAGYLYMKKEKSNVRNPQWKR